MLMNLTNFLKDTGHIIDEKGDKWICTQDNGFQNKCVNTDFCSKYCFQQSYCNQYAIVDDYAALLDNTQTVSDLIKRYKL